MLLARPFDPVVFERADFDDDIAYARVTQVLLDLMTGPGRGPAEAAALLAWMRDNEARWRLSDDRDYVDARETLLDAVEAPGAPRRCGDPGGCPSDIPAYGG